MKVNGYILLAAAALFVLTGCNLAGLSGALPSGLNSEHVALAAKSVRAVSVASRSISDSEEYYVGRAVAARILATYPLLRNSRLTEYVNLVGQTVALNSEKPNTFGGYHFAVLDSAEVNAFACPGGTILITRGMLRSVRTEDELAAVLAHEVAHINHRDGIEAISKSRWTEALTIIGTEAVKTYGSSDVARLTGIFEGSIDDVFKTLVVNGYGRGQEEDADRTSLGYLSRAGYDPHALESFLSRLTATGQGASGGILKTHPATSDRLDVVRSNLPTSAVDPLLEKARESRFSASASF
jgi:predicted Zn-dependent protease